MSTLRRMSQTRVNRRGFLAAAGLTGVGAALAACTSSGGERRPSRRPRRVRGGARAVRRGRLARPRSGTSKKSSSCTTGATTSPPANIEAFKAEYGLTKFQYDTFANNEELLAKLQGGASGYDIAAPTAEYIPAMVEEGFLQKLDLSRIPNVKNISDTFKNLWWDPTNEYQVPKDYGTTGVLYRSSMLPSVPKSWKEFYDLVLGAGSGKTVFVDSMGDVIVFPLKMLGYSLNSVDEGRAGRGARRSCSTSRRTCSRSTRTRTAR